MKLITFESVLEKLNTHTKVSRKGLVCILTRMMLVATGISIFLDSLLFASVYRINSMYLVGVFLVAYCSVILMLDSMSKSKEVYNIVMQWSSVSSVVSLIMASFGCVILVAF